MERVYNEAPDFGMWLSLTAEALQSISCLKKRYEFNWRGFEMKLGAEKVSELHFRRLRLKLVIYNKGPGLIERVQNAAGIF